MIVVGLNGRAGSGKSTVASHLVGEHGFEALAFADPLWAMLEVVGVDSERVAHDRQYKDHHVLPDIRKTPRELIQTLGTEWGRQLVHPDLWVIIARRQIEAHQRLHGPISRLVFTDVRFDNEAAFITGLGGKIWHVNRPTATGAGAHTSERGIDLKYVHRGIANDSTLTALYEIVDKRAEELLEETDGLA